MSEQNGIYSYNPSTNEILFRLNPICKCNKEVVQVLNEQQATINNQEQKIKILQQEINDTQAILGMLTEKLKGWNDE